MKWRILSFAFIFLINKVYSQSCTLDAKVINSSYFKYNPKPAGAGKDVKVYIAFKNTGTCSWDVGKVKLFIEVVTKPSTAKGDISALTPYIALKNKVAAGDMWEVEYTFECPYYLGRYMLNWQVMVNNKKIGPPYKDWITIEPPK